MTTRTGAAVGAAGPRKKGAAASQQHLPPVIGGAKFEVPALARKTGLKTTGIESLVQGTNLGIVWVRTEDGAHD